MSQSLSHNLILAIKSDELAIFADLIKGREDWAIGRFPILSICYMYGAKKIIKFYEKLLLNVTSYKVVDEEYGIYRSFASIAGKNLRLYVGDKVVVSPVEMLAILHKDNKCKKAYKLYKSNGYLTSRIIKNLNYIYSTYRQSPKINGDSFKISFRPLLNAQKIAYRVAICFALIFMVGFAGSYMYLNSTVGFGTAINPYKVYMQSQLLSAIKSNSHVLLTKDITLTEDISQYNFSGGIDGGGHTLYVDNVSSQLLQSNSGIIKNINIKYNSIERNINNSFSLLVNENSGKINNTTISCDKISMVCDKSMADMYISGVANKNTGSINGCSVKSIIDVKTTANGDCYVSGIVGKNEGEITNCTFVNDSSIISYEADLSGICAKNEEKGKVAKCINYASLTQTSDTDEWSPNVAGVVMNNYGTIENCENHGALVIESNNNNLASKSSVIVGGIVATNYGSVGYSKNYGAITATSINDKEDVDGNIFIGGISATNYSRHYNCLNQANITASAKQYIIYCGGLSGLVYYDTQLGQQYPIIESCGTSGNIDISADGNFAFGGGFVGRVYKMGEIKDCYSLMTFERAGDDNKQFFGSAIGCVDIKYIVLGTKYLNLIAENNYVLTQDKAEHQMGVLIYDRFYEGGNLSPNITSSSAEEIKSQGVYWV